MVTCIQGAPVFGIRFRFETGLGRIRRHDNGFSQSSAWRSSALVIGSYSLGNRPKAIGAEQRGQILVNAVDQPRAFKN